MLTVEDMSFCWFLLMAHLKSPGLTLLWSHPAEQTPSIVPRPLPWRLHTGRKHRLCEALPLQQEGSWREGEKAHSFQPSFLFSNTASSEDTVLGPWNRQAMFSNTLLHDYLLSVLTVGCSGVWLHECIHGHTHTFKAFKHNENLLASETWPNSSRSPFPLTYSKWLLHTLLFPHPSKLP